MSTAQRLVGALVAAMVLAGLQLPASCIGELLFVPERAAGSCAGGLAVAYVFLHLLSEIPDGTKATGVSPQILAS